MHTIIFEYEIEEISKMKNEIEISVNELKSIIDSIPEYENRKDLQEILISNCYFELDSILKNINKINI
jgi:poly(A) polymerase Pap1